MKKFRILNDYDKLKLIRGVHHSFLLGTILCYSCVLITEPLYISWFITWLWVIASRNRCILTDWENRTRAKLNVPKINSFLDVYKFWRI